ncbi:MAG: tyrosine--tRNA ligase [Gemmatimonadota bacterium]|nr:tyrosine--tRNA ligase [Gemmatimonadota bacterium]
MPANSFPAPLAELAWRGLLYQYTDGIEEWLAGSSRSAYCGFDPTAPSLHVGNLIPVMGLVHLQRAGHRPVIVVGGGTGMIGDPGGKSAERPLASIEMVEANSAAIRSQLERFISFDGPHAAITRNNADWLRPLAAIEFLRDVGKHFSVNVMLAKESVQSRLEGGISFTEFSYMLLQAYDFLELRRRDDVSLQIGGSDQWGNITAGVDLIRRVAALEAHGFTMPLVTTAGGAKFGKTEAGAVWLDPERTSPFRFYQFWVNADDRDVQRLLRFFTLMPQEQIGALERDLEEHPERRLAQQALASEVTTRVHGATAASVATELSGLLFGKADVTALSASALDALAREVPFATVKRSDAGAAEGTQLDVLELFTLVGLAASRGAARRLLEQGGLSVNGRKLAADERQLAPDGMLAGGHLLLRKGAREYGLVRVR